MHDRLPTRIGRRSLGLALPAVLALAVLPASASAHGASDPDGSNYLARIRSVPTGLQAKVVDGDLRLWLRVPSTATVVVPDYQGAPFLRFSPSGVAVNENSEMYFYDGSPPSNPPLGLSPRARPEWVQVSQEHTYVWHDARLGALADAALVPGRSYVGPWRIPLVLDGRPTAVSGAVYHRSPPSIVWFWPIVVLIGCIPAAWRLDRPRLHARLARGLAVLALVGVVVGAVGRCLHGRPVLSGFSLIVLGVLLTLVAVLLFRLSRRQPGFATYVIVAGLSAWEGLTLVPVLSHGYVLLAVPALASRIAAVACLGSCVPLMALAWRMSEASSEVVSAHAGPPLEHAPV